VISTKVLHLGRLLADCNFLLLKKLARKNQHSSFFGRSIGVEDFCSILTFASYVIFAIDIRGK
jgi:hypothetical protein